MAGAAWATATGYPTNTRHEGGRAWDHLAVWGLGAFRNPDQAAGAATPSEEEPRGLDCGEGCPFHTARDRGRVWPVPPPCT